MDTEKQVRIKLKGDSQTNWENNNPTLLENEIGIEHHDYGTNIKIGDGTTAWEDLEYSLGYTDVDGGFAAGYGAQVGSEGGAIGSNAFASSGFAGGHGAYAGYGAAIGYETKTNGGVAAGESATTVNNNKAIDAIQLGKGNNPNAKTFQVYDYPVLDADGKIPNDRLNSATVEDCLLFVTCSTGTESNVINSTDCIYIYLKESAVNWCSSTWKDEYLDATKYDLYIDFPNFGDTKFSGFPADGTGDISYNTWDEYRTLYEKDQYYGAIVNGEQAICIPYSVTEEEHWNSDYFKRIFHVKVVSK